MMRSTRLWIALTVASWLFTVFLLPGWLRPDYHPLAQYISELGATGAPHAGWVNWAGYLPSGLFFAIALASFWRHWRPRGVQAAGLALLFCEPLAWIGSAIFPCDLGCPAQGSLAQNLHNVLALFTYTGTGLGVTLLACAPGLRVWQRLGWLLLVVVWFGLFLAMLTPELGAVRGLLQRAGEGLMYGSQAVVGWVLAGRAPPPRPGQR